MARQFTSPILLPSAPSAGLHAATKSYVDTGDAASAPASRLITAGTGLTGGGDLTADRTLTVAYGTSSTTATVGNDSRVANAVQTSTTVTAGSGLGGGGALSSNITLTAARVTSPANTVTYSATLALDPTLGNNQNITATGALSLSISTTGAIDGQMVMVSVLAQTTQRVVTLTSTNIPAGLSSTLAIASGKVGLLGFRYVGLASTWVLMSSTQTT
jgi:hypothetical protein